MYDGRVEISNPGGLVSAIKLADFGKRSHSRNSLIFGLFARMQLVEQIGWELCEWMIWCKKPGYTTWIHYWRHVYDNTSEGPETFDNPGDKLKENTRKKVLDIMSIKGIVINREKEELAD